jgi:hypothetical protein
MSQLPLDDGQRHSLARELDRVRVTELVFVPTSAQTPPAPLALLSADERRLGAVPAQLSPGESR